MAFRSAEILSANTKKTRSRSRWQGKKKSKFPRWATCINLKLETTNLQPEGMVKQIVHSSAKVLIRTRHAVFVRYLHLKYPDKRVCFRSQVQVTAHHFGEIKAGSQPTHPHFHSQEQMEVHASCCLFPADHLCQSFLNSSPSQGLAQEMVSPQLGWIFPL